MHTSIGRYDIRGTIQGAGVKEWQRHVDMILLVTESFRLKLVGRPAAQPEGEGPVSKMEYSLLFDPNFNPNKSDDARFDSEVVHILGASRQEAAAVFELAVTVMTRSGCPQAKRVAANEARRLYYARQSL